MWHQRKSSPASRCENEELSEHVPPVLTCWQWGPPPIVHWPSISHSPEQCQVVTLTYSKAIKSSTFPLPLLMTFRISLVQIIMENIFPLPNKTDRESMNVATPSQRWEFSTYILLYPASLNLTGPSYHLSSKSYYSLNEITNFFLSPDATFDSMTDSVYHSISQNGLVINCMKKNPFLWGLFVLI